MVALTPRPRPCSSHTTTQNSTLHPRAAPLPAALELPRGADSGAQGGAGARAGGVDTRVHPAAGPNLHQAGPAVLHPQRPLPRRVHRGAQQAAGTAPACCIGKAAFRIHASCAAWCTRVLACPPTHCVPPAACPPLPGCRTVCPPSVLTRPRQSLSGSWGPQWGCCSRPLTGSPSPPHRWARCGWRGLVRAGQGWAEQGRAGQGGSKDGSNIVW